jgi:DNA-binding IclR family transcriptional regulator
MPVDERLERERSASATSVKRRGGRPARSSPGTHLDLTRPLERAQTRLTSTVQTAATVLRSFTLETPTRGVNDLSRQLGMSKSSVSRLLATLEAERLVRRDPGSEKYQLGLGLLEIAGVLLNQLDVRQVALPFLRELAAATRETVSLATLDDVNVMLIEHVPSTEAITYLGRIGHRTPAYCSSGGKAILAYSDPARVQVVIDAGLVRYTPRTITSPEVLLRDLEETRRRGYSINEGEFRNGLNAVAAPVWDASGAVVAAVALAGPGFRLDREQLLRVGGLVRRTADDISRQLGAIPPPPGSDQPAGTPA